MKQRIIWLILASLPVFALVPAAAALADRISETRQNELIYLVRQDCGSCHGMTLKGGLGKALLPHDVADTPEEALAAIILDGIPDIPMPPWRGLLTEDEALWIARQLKKGLPE